MVVLVDKSFTLLPRSKFWVSPYVEGELLKLKDMWGVFTKWSNSNHLGETLLCGAAMDPISHARRQNNNNSFTELLLLLRCFAISIIIIIINFQL